jgi:hypothetical protein
LLTVLPEAEIVVLEPANVVPKAEIVLLKGETVIHIAENVVPEANMTMMDTDTATMVPEANVSPNSDEKNLC